MSNRLILKSLIHPIQSFEDIKKKNTGSVGVAIFIVLIWFVVAIFERQYTNFRFNPENPETLNILYLFIRTIVLYVLWVISNWAFCTLLEGKGRFRDIAIAAAYSLIPYLVAVFTVTVAGQFMAIGENIFLSLILFLGAAWSGLLLFTSQMTIHEYTAGKTLITILVTLVGILLIIFIVLLVGCLFQQLFGFIQSILSELFYRFS